MSVDLPNGLTFDVEPIAGAGTESVEIGLAYWSLSGVDQFGGPAWLVPVKEIDTRGRGQANVIAAAGVRAVVAKVRCGECGESLRLRTRSSLSDVLAGGSTHCVECDPKLMQKVATVMAPENEEARQRREDRVRQREREQRRQEVYQLERDRWVRHQRQTLVEKFAVTQVEDSIPAASVQVELTTLTLLRFASQVDPIPSMRQWHHDFPFHCTDGPRFMLNDVRSEQLLVPDSRSPVNAFVWEPAKFDDVWAAIDDPSGSFPMPTLTERYYPLDTQWRIPFGPSQDSARALLDEHLCERLAPENMTAQRQEDALVAVHEVLTGEALRWFGRELDRHNLPPVSENHAPRLAEAVQRLMGEFSLGFAYFLGWKAVKTAAAAAQANPKAPKANMTTHGVNMFEREVQQALDARPVNPREFTERHDFSLAATTKTLFYTVLHMDPMRTSVATVRAAMPAPVSPISRDLHHVVDTEWLKEGFRLGSSSWAEFGGDSAGEVMGKAATFMVEMEKLSPVTVASLHWQTFPDDNEFIYVLRVELDDKNELHALPDVGSSLDH